MNKLAELYLERKLIMDQDWSWRMAGYRPTGPVICNRHNRQMCIREEILEEMERTGKPIRVSPLAKQGANLSDGRDRYFDTVAEARAYCEEIKSEYWEYYINV